MAVEMTMIDAEGISSVGGPAGPGYGASVWVMAGDIVMIDAEGISSVGGPAELGNGAGVKGRAVEMTMIEGGGISAVGFETGPGYGPKDMAVTIVESSLEIVPAPAVEAAEENASELGTEASHGMIAPPAP